MDDISRIKMWNGETMGCFEISEDCVNEKGDVIPTVGEAIKILFPRHPQSIVNVKNFTCDVKSYRKAVVKKLNEINRTEIDLYVDPYHDFLQLPLQPLSKDLNDQTYEVFEKDPVKYDLYKDAIAIALESVPKKVKKIVVMVLGAGRGPLVKSVFRAIAHVGVTRPVRIYVVEKNINACITLSCLKNEIWKKEDVIIVKEDIRFWDAPEKADIVISELLGSFGDNELAPECLESSAKFLRGPKSVCIPNRSTSFVLPVSSNFLSVKLNSLKQQNPGVQEIHSVTKIRKASYFGNEPQACFEFNYPKDDRSKNRIKRIKFKAGFTAEINGFTGYFRSRLSKDLSISIVPGSETKDMFSWFPLFFPCDPLMAKEGDDIFINIWRINSGGKVWYEWCVESTSAGCTKIHNSNGKYFKTDL